MRETGAIGSKALETKGMTDRLREMMARRPFLKDVSIMLTGAAGGQMVSLALSPILTRLYTPQEFGTLSIYSAVVAILVVVSSMRYELALPLAKTDEDAVNLMAVCLCVLATTTLVLSAVACLVPAAVMARLWPIPGDQGPLKIYRLLLVLGYVCLGGYFVALYVATRASAYRAIAKTRLAQGVVGPTTQIVMALFGLGAPGLLVGSILGQSAGTVGLFNAMFAGRTHLLKAISWERMRAQAFRYRQFPLVASWAALIDAIGGSQLLYLLIGATYSARIAGFLFLAERVVSRPLAIIGTSILQVFVGEAGRTVDSDPALLKRRFYQVVTRQAALAAIWIVMANLLAIFLFSTLFGKEWQDAVPYLQAISLAYLAQAAVLPVFHTLQILEKQSMAAFWQIGRLILTVGVFFGAGSAGLAAPMVIAAYSVAQMAACIVLLVMMARSIQQVQRTS
jgi:O-antigen/teichoic acid export membrane protein